MHENTWHLLQQKKCKKEIPTKASPVITNGISPKNRCKLHTAEAVTYDVIIKYSVKHINKHNFCKCEQNTIRSLRYLKLKKN